MRYRVKALAAGGALTVLHVDAPDPAQAGRIAGERGLSVLSVRAELAPLRWLAPRSGGFPLPLFAQQFVALLSAGLGTVEALEAMASEASRSHGSTLRELLGHVRAGRNLSWAMEQMPRAFPPLFVATVRASERTGDLREALLRYLAYEQQIEQLRRKVVNASVYPALLLVAGGAVAAFLLLYVVPRFASIYDDIGGELPWLSRLMMDWGQLLASHAAAVAATVAAVLAGLAYAFTRPGWWRWLGQRLWALPQFGEWLRVYQLARLYRTLGMLLRSGLPLVSALELADGLLAPALRGALAEARRAISEGQPVAASLATHGLTTPIAASMLGVGERSGELGAMMDRVAALYDDQLARWVELGTRLIEPLLMAAIGTVIGLIVILLYMPVFELAGSLR